MSNLNNIIDLLLIAVERKKFDLNLTPIQAIKAGKLLMQVAVKLNKNKITYLTSFKSNFSENWLEILALIIDEYDVDNEEYSSLSKDIFNLIREVLKSDKEFELMQISELLKIAGDFGKNLEGFANEIREVSENNFLDKDMTQPDKIKQSSTTETEKKPKQKNDKRN